MSTEDAVRQIKLNVCKEFKNFSPIGFTESTTVKLDATVKRALPNCPRRILRAKGKVQHTKKRIAVLFSGGPAAGGHNVIAGIKRIIGKSTLLGVRGGPAGLLKGDLFTITDADVKRIFNTGGFDLLGTDRTKLKSKEQFAAVKQVCISHKLDGIIVIGGDDSNTNAAFLAEYLRKDIHSDGRGVCVIGVPKTMDGDLQYGDLLPISFGFDTAAKTYAELVGNICKDTKSSQKYWHFVKLMGRSASHVTLEVALQTQPTITLISEEINHKQSTLQDVINHIAHAVVQRAHANKNYGVVLVPEGLLEFIPEMNSMIDAINAQLQPQEFRQVTIDHRIAVMQKRLFAHHGRLFAKLPRYVQEMLVADRDAHSNLKVSQIETERLLADLVALRVQELDKTVRFETNKHFFGYEGRCGTPTIFDMTLAYNLGLTAGSLIMAGKSGYIASVTDLDKGGSPLAIPMAAMMTEETRGKEKSIVISKELVRLTSPAFKHLQKHRDTWEQHDSFICAGPIQFWGLTAGQLPITVALNRKYKAKF